jgi:hypothetical protein
MPNPLRKDDEKQKENENSLCNAVSLLLIRFVNKKFKFFNLINKHEDKNVADIQKTE